MSFLSFSASSFFMPSFSIFGAASTRSLASFSPIARASLTTLMTAIFCAPASESSTLNTVFSSFASPEPAAEAGPATTAAAETPNFFSSVFTSSCRSMTDICSTASMIDLNFAGISTGSSVFTSSTICSISLIRARISPRISRNLIRDYSSLN